MDHRQLQIFLVTARRLNLSHAAEDLRMTQPGLSKSLQRLQHEIRAKLYQRRGRGIELTEAGRVLLKHAQLLETQLADARAELNDFVGGTLGHTRIGAGPSWLSRHLPQTIGRITACHPGIQLSVDVGFPDRLIRRLRLGELDIVVGALPENRLDPDLKFARLTSDMILVTGRSGHPLLQVKDRSLADYVGYKWALPGRQELVRQRLIRSFVGAGLPEPSIAVETDSASLILSVLRASDCLGLATAQILAQPEATGLVPIGHDALRFRREAGIISRRHGELSPSTRIVITELRKVVAAHDRV